MDDIFGGHGVMVINEGGSLELLMYKNKLFHDHRASNEGVEYVHGGLSLIHKGDFNKQQH